MTISWRQESGQKRPKMVETTKSESGGVTSEATWEWNLDVLMAWQEGQWREREWEEHVLVVRQYSLRGLLETFVLVGFWIFDLIFFYDELTCAISNYFVFFLIHCEIEVIFYHQLLIKLCSERYIYSFSNFNTALLWGLCDVFCSVWICLLFMNYQSFISIIFWFISQRKFMWWEHIFIISIDLELCVWLCVCVILCDVY